METKFLFLIKYGFYLSINSFNFIFRILYLQYYKKLCIHNILVKKYISVI